MREAVSAAFVAGLIFLAGFTAEPPPAVVLVGLDCQGEAVRVYGAEDGPEAADACRTVERHALGR